MCCREVIQELQESYPDIVLTHVAACDDKNNGVLCPLDNLVKRSYGVREYQLGQWIINQSDYLLCYVYSALDYPKLIKLTCCAR